MRHRHQSPADALTIRAGLPHFRLVQAVHAVGDRHIDGQAQFHQADAFAGIESLAQLGALHVRYLNNFQGHAFLLKVEDCSLPGTGRLDGVYDLNGELIHQSRRAFRYRLEARRDSVIDLRGHMIFAVADYDDRFSGNRLRAHYQEMFACLRSASATS